VDQGRPAIRPARPLGLEPIQGRSEAEDAREGAGDCFVAGGQGRHSLSLLQRRSTWGGPHQGRGRRGWRARFAPFVQHQMMASTVRRRSETAPWCGDGRSGWTPPPPLARPSAPPCPSRPPFGRRRATHRTPAGLG
jgi:hypothetical protein